MILVLEGVRRDRLGAGAAASVLARDGKVAYCVAAAPRDAKASGRRDKRANERRRSRLRSAKLLDASNRFLCECLVHDRSSSGLRIKLMRNIGLPARCRLYDDETGQISLVATAWRRGAVLGMRYLGGEGSATLSASARAALGGRYYAIVD
ncbi:MAG TPA: hypothetical protein VKS78_10265 [Roseiarcus sp.]|nr:hypothetical protein [Roseiarcus sp.]